MTTNNPGCFGAATTYAMDAAFCQKCHAFEACGKEAMQTLERIKNVVRIDDLVKRHRAAREKAIQEMIARDRLVIAAAPPGPIATPTPTKPVARVTPLEKVEFEVSEKHSRAIAKMPVKAQSFAMMLCKRGLVQMMRRDMVNKKTTPGIPKWLAIAMQMLNEEGFTRASLKTRLVSELGWTDSTAASHISIATALLIGFEIAMEAGDRFQLSPTISMQQ